MDKTPEGLPMYFPAWMRLPSRRFRGEALSQLSCVGLVVLAVVMLVVVSTKRMAEVLRPGSEGAWRGKTVLWL